MSVAAGRAHVASRHEAPHGGACELLYWDGRIDNARELTGLFGHGCSDDASTVRAVYDSAAVPGLGRVIGDWSAVIRDRRTGAIVLASDFMGIRPLYFCVTPGSVRWSVSLAALVDDHGTARIAEEYITGFLVCGGCPERTPFEGIRSVPPGFAVVIGADSESRQSLWTLPVGRERSYRDDRAYGDELMTLFSEAVSARLRNARRAVCELSGGVDSSAVVGMTSALLKSGAVPAKHVSTLSFVHPESLDIPFIGEVERFAGFEGRRLSIGEAPLFAPGVAGALPHEGAPLQSAAAAAVRDCGAPVCLTGQGGDLLMGNWLDDSQQVAAFVRRGRPVAAFREAVKWSRAARLPLLGVLWRAHAAVLATAVRWPRCAIPATLDRTSLLSRRVGRLVPRAAGLFSRDWSMARPERQPHFLNLTLTRELRGLQAPEPLTATDYTHPFFHRPLVEFLMTIPASVLCGPGEPRRLMRKTFASLWPPAVRRRRSKSLFSAPYLDALRSFAAMLLNDRHWHVVEHGWVDAARFRARLERLSRGFGEHGGELRQVLLLENWLRVGAHASRKIRLPLNP